MASRIIEVAREDFLKDPAAAVKLAEDADVYVVNEDGSTHSVISLPSDDRLDDGEAAELRRENAELWALVRRAGRCTFSCFAVDDRYENPSDLRKDITAALENGKALR